MRLGPFEIVFSRALLRVVLLDLCAAALLFGACELGLRWLQPAWAVPPTTDDLTYGHPVRLNSLYFRGPELSAREPGERRILVVGNSTTFGTGVAEESTYPAQLQRLVQPGVQVINGGGVGAILERLIGVLDKQGREIEPSLIVFGFSPSMVAVNVPGAHFNDSPAAPPARSPLELLRRVHKSLYGTYTYPTVDALLRGQLYRLGILEDRLDQTTGATFAYGFDVPGADLKLVRDSYARMQTDLARVKELSEELGAPLVVLLIPSRFELSREAFDNERGVDLSRATVDPGAEMKAICARLGVPVVDLLPVLKSERQKNRDPLYIRNDYSHLNESGHALAARALFEEFVRTWELAP